MKPFVPTKVEALNLCGLRVVLIDGAGKVVFKIPHASVLLALDMAESNSHEFTALVARDGEQLAYFKDGKRKDIEHKGFKKLLQGKD